MRRCVPFTNAYMTPASATPTVIMVPMIQTVSGFTGPSYRYFHRIRAGNALSRRRSVGFRLRLHAAGIERRVQRAANAADWQLQSIRKTVRELNAVLVPKALELVATRPARADGRRARLAREHQTVGRVRI